MTKINKNIKRKRLRHKLRQRDGDNCYYCKRVMRFDGKVCGNFATFEHLKTKLDGRRGFFDGGVVLACYSCNQRVGNEKLATIAKDDPRRKCTPSKLEAALERASKQPVCY